MTPREYGFLVKVAMTQPELAEKDASLAAILQGLRGVGGAAARGGSRLFQAIKGIPTNAATAARSAAFPAVGDAAAAGGTAAATNLGVGGIRTVGNTIMPVIGNAIAGLGGAVMYPAGAAAKYVLSPTIKGVGYLASNLAGGGAQVAGNVLMDSAFSKNPLARVLQTVTGGGVALAGGRAGYDYMKNRGSK